MESTSLNLVVTAMNQNLVVMLESAAKNVYQQDFLKAIKFGVKECQKIIKAIESLQKKKKNPKREVTSVGIDESLLAGVRSLSEMRLKEIFRNTQHDKLSRDDAVKNVRNDVLEKIRVETENFNMDAASEAFNTVCKQIFRDLILNDSIR